MKILPMILAHTGNDTVDHSFKMADGIIGLVIFIVLILIVVYFIKKWLNRNSIIFNAKGSKKQKI